MIRTVIIDDEKACRESLKGLLQECCKDVEICGMADSIETGFLLINEKKPDLVFLDVMMPPDDGFSLLKMFPAMDFEVVFTTAYSQFAIQAIKVSALDYLLKPIGLSDLKDAVQKVREKQKITSKDKEREKEKASKQISTGRIVLPGQESYIFIDPKEMVRAEAVPGHKTIVKMRDNREIIVCKELGDLEATLDEHGCQRVHRSHIINFSAITKYFADKGGGSVMMSDGKIVPVSLKRKDEFLRNFGVV